MTQRLNELLQTRLDQRKENEQSDYSEAEVQQWVDDISENKPFDSIEALANLLKSFNESLLQKSSRFALLEILRPVVDWSVPYLTSSYEHKPWPLSANGLALATQVEKVLTTFFIGYALSAVEKSAPANRGRILHRVVDFGCRKYLERARRFRTLSQRDGELIFAFFRQARQEELHTVPVEPWDAPESTNDSGRLSIEKLFLRFLILLLLKPASWWPGDADVIYKQVGEWLNDLDELADHPPRKGEFVFAVNLDQPGEPVFFPVPAKTSEQHKNTLYFVLDDVVARLRRQPLMPSKKSAEDALGLYPSLNERLLQTLEKSKLPQSPLKPELYPKGITVIQGIEAVQQWFLRDDGSVVPSLSKVEEPGIAIQMMREQAAHVQVGDLMAWHEDPSAPVAEWQLAEVAWMLSADDQQADIGLTFLKGSVQGGMIESVIATKNEGGSSDIPCLILTQTASKASKTELTIVVAPNAVATGAMLELKLPKLIHLIELAELHRQTPRYACWKATRIQTVKRDSGV